MKSSEIKNKVTEMFVHLVDAIQPILAWEGVKISSETKPFPAKLIELYHTDILSNNKRGTNLATAKL